nr:MAG: hypothetical protein [Bacteriophage sp.]
MEIKRILELFNGKKVDISIVSKDDTSFDFSEVYIFTSDQLLLFEIGKKSAGGILFEKIKHLRIREIGDDFWVEISTKLYEGELKKVKGGLTDEK